MKLTIIRGLPGSGKSTYARKLGCFHLESDMFLYANGEYKFSQDRQKHSHMTCKNMVDAAMNEGVSEIAVSNTFTRQWEIDPYIELAKEYGYSVEIVRMTGNYGSIHGVPEAVIQAMQDRFENVKGETLNVTKGM
jgi:predicted kinase